MLQFLPLLEFDVDIPFHLHSPNYVTRLGAMSNQLLVESVALLRNPKSSGRNNGNQLWNSTKAETAARQWLYQMLCLPLSIYLVTHGYCGAEIVASRLMVNIVSQFKVLSSPFPANDILGWLPSWYVRFLGVVANGPSTWLGFGLLGGKNAHNVHR